MQKLTVILEKTTLIANGVVHIRFNSIFNCKGLKSVKTSGWLSP